MTWTKFSNSSKIVRGRIPTSTIDTSLAAPKPDWQGGSAPPPPSLGWASSQVARPDRPRGVLDIDKGMKVLDHHVLRAPVPLLKKITSLKISPFPPICVSSRSLPHQPTAPFPTAPSISPSLPRSRRQGAQPQTRILPVRRQLRRRRDSVLGRPTAETTTTAATTTTSAAAAIERSERFA